MNPKQKDTFITLDWDEIPLELAYERILQILDEYPDIYKLVLSQSSTKGYHCRLYFSNPVNVVNVRMALGDDLRRLVHDLCNSNPSIYNILWDRKVFTNETRKAVEIICLIR